MFKIVKKKFDSIDKKFKIESRKSKNLHMTNTSKIKNLKILCLYKSIICKRFQIITTLIT